MTPPPLLLDTCAVIWLAAGEELSDSSQAAMKAALAGGGSLSVSPMSAWEVGMLSARGRLALTMRPQAWFAALMAKPAMAVAPLDADVLLASCELPGQPPTDPVDRILIATARERGFRLVTRDRVILAYANAGYLDTLPC